MLCSQAASRSLIPQVMCCDFSMLRSLESSLKSEKTSVSTVAGLLDLALLKSPELVLILESVEHFSVKFVLQRFKNKFKSLWKVSEASMSLISILLMGRFNAEKARAAIKYAGSRSLRSLQRDIPVVNKSGSVPVLEVKYKEMVLTDMPGYAELLATVDKAVVEEHWKALEDFIVGSVCFIKDVKKRLEEATADLEEFCGKDMEDAGDMLAAYNSLFDVCTSWLGTAIEGEFQKIQRFLKKCPEEVKDEYAEYISPKYNGAVTNELTMQWAEFEVIIQNVWSSWRVKSEIRSSLGRPEVKIVGPRDRQFRQTAAAAPADTAHQPARKVDTSGDNFRGIDCKKCAKSFSPSLRQVEKFEQHSIPLPDECPKCKGQVCDNWKLDGDCSWGENCKFLHPAEFKKAEGAGPERDAVGGICRFYSKGKCMAGDRCKFDHIEPPGAADATEGIDNNGGPRRKFVHMAAIMSSDDVRKKSKEIEDIDY